MSATVVQVLSWEVYVDCGRCGDACTHVVTERAALDEAAGDDVRAAAERVGRRAARDAGWREVRYGGERADHCPACMRLRRDEGVARALSQWHPKYTGGAVCTTCNGTRVRDGSPCVCTGEAP